MSKDFLASGKVMAVINIGIGLTVLLALSPPAAAKRPLTVCETLSDLDKYRGKMVTIRGVMISTGQVMDKGTKVEGWVLYDYDQVQNPCPAVVKRDLKWPSSIYLSWPTDSNPEDGPITFQPDRGAIEKTLAKMEKISGDVRIIATIQGELRARKDIEISRAEDGGYTGNGYGIDGRNPAQLVIKKVTDFRSVPGESWKQRKENK